MVSHASTIMLKIILERIRKKTELEMNKQGFDEDEEHVTRSQTSEF